MLICVVMCYLSSKFSLQSHYHLSSGFFSTVYIYCIPKAVLNPRNCLTYASVSQEFQQVVMGLKREHKDTLEKVQQDQEVSIFNLRGEQAEKLCQYERRIRELEVELEKLKTVSAIQVSASLCRTGLAWEKGVISVRPGGNGTTGRSEFINERRSGVIGICSSS